MSLKGYHEASLHPPAAYDAAAATVWDWGEALLDKSAYMVHKKDHQKNHTSARCTFKRNLDDDGVVEVEMQVSLFLAPPPRVSYSCCSANLTEDHHGEQQGTPRLFVREPWVIATEGKLALLALCHGYNPAYYGESNNYDYFLYEAAASPAGTPKLTCLPQIQPEMLPAMGTHCFSTSSIGVVRYRSPKDDDAYRIAAFADDYFHPSHSGYYLCTYDSKDHAWIRKPASFPQPPPHDDFVPDKVITIGGIMGWVDLWSGMVLCDVLATTADDTLCTPLHYLALPDPRQPENRLPLATDIAYFFRDIALANDSGIIRFVDLQVRAEPYPRSQTPSGWTVVTWTLEGLNDGLDTLFFRQEHEFSRYPRE
uniref:DUF1618 domain-containing protein n=2 Tax=Aegilops tauschii TaxID=37682 RepID=A0A453E4F3_AEGTS